MGAHPLLRGIQPARFQQQVGLQGHHARVGGKGARGHLQVLLRCGAVAQQAPRLGQGEPTFGVVRRQALAALQRITGFGNALQHEGSAPRAKPGLGLRRFMRRHGAEVAESLLRPAQVQQREAQVEVPHKMVGVQLHGPQTQLDRTLGQAGSPHQLAQVGRVSGVTRGGLHGALQAGRRLQVPPGIRIQDGQEVPRIRAVRHLVQQPAAQVFGRCRTPRRTLGLCQLQHLGEEGGLHGRGAGGGDRFL